MSKIIGIDLGTTNSAVAIIEGGQPKIIENIEGNRTTPSVVAIGKTGDRLVGLVAKRQAVTNPENTIYGIKRFMGHRFEDPEIQKDRSTIPYKIQQGENGGAEVKMSDKWYRPEEISAMILAKIKADVEAKLGEKITEAVITVPAYFNDAQRKATKDAGAIAGLDVKRIINEPTAAALAYGFNTKKNEKIVVYDFGGGTFDVSVLEVGDDVIEVKSTDGDSHMGGNLYLNGDDESTIGKEFFQIAVEGGNSSTSVSSYTFTPSGTYTVTNSGADNEYYTLNENNTMYVDISAIVSQGTSGGTVLAGMKGSSILFGTDATSDTTRSTNSLSYTALTDMLKGPKTTITK
jgi:hypothetical protein